MVANSRTEGTEPRLGISHRSCQPRQVLEGKQGLPNSRGRAHGAGEWVRQGTGKRAVCSGKDPGFSCLVAGKTAEGTGGKGSRYGAMGSGNRGRI